MLPAAVCGFAVCCLARCPSRCSCARRWACRYNSVNGAPTCANDGLLNKILRDQWKFDGFVVSDYDGACADSFRFCDSSTNPYPNPLAFD